MNLSISTIVSFNGVTHAEIKKIIDQERVDDVFVHNLRKDPVKKRGIAMTYATNDNIQQLKIKNSSKLLVNDCVLTKRKVGCWHCREREGKRKNGMPLNIITVENTQEETNNILRYGFFCKTNCCYKYILDRCHPGHPCYEIYKRAKENIELLHRLQYPEKGCIKPANDWEELKFNGGSLDYDMWEDESLSFRQIVGFSNVYISKMYMQS